MTKTEIIPLHNGKIARQIEFADKENGLVNGKSLHGVLVEPTLIGVRIGTMRKGKEGKDYLQIPYEDMPAVIAALQMALAQKS